MTNKEASKEPYWMAILTADKMQYRRFSHTSSRKEVSTWEDTLSIEGFHDLEQAFFRIKPDGKVGVIFFVVPKETDALEHGGRA